MSGEFTVAGALIRFPNRAQRIYRSLLKGYEDFSDAACFLLVWALCRARPRVAARRGVVVLVSWVLVRQSKRFAMAYKDWKFSQRAAATAVSLVLGTSAQALVVKGSFDPAFGAAYPNLGFRGYGEFFIDDACLNVPSGTFVWWDSTCGGAVNYTEAMGLISAQVELYDTRDSGANTLQTLAFTSPDPLAIPGDNGPMWGVFLEYDSGLGRNTITGVDTLYIGPQYSTLDTEIYNGPLWLFFVSGQKPIGCFSEADCSSGSGSGSGSGSSCGGSNFCIQSIATTTAMIATCDQFEFQCGPETISNPAEVTFAEVPSQVPEPGTLALLLGALGGGWLTRRRQKKTT
ncbi:MAG: PEP-CTERM sorting domain-containing protein [Betaproteobacteria bacterium]